MLISDFDPPLSPFCMCAVHMSWFAFCPVINTIITKLGEEIVYLADTF